MSDPSIEEKVARLAVAMWDGRAPGTPTLTHGQIMALARAALAALQGTGAEELSRCACCRLAMEVVVNDEALVERMAEAMQQATHKPGESAFKAMARAALAALQQEPPYTAAELSEAAARAGNLGFNVDASTGQGTG